MTRLNVGQGPHVLMEGSVPPLQVVPLPLTLSPPLAKLLQKVVVVTPKLKISVGTIGNSIIDT